MVLYKKCKSKMNQAKEREKPMSKNENDLKHSDADEMMFEESEAREELQQEPTADAESFETTAEEGKQPTEDVNANPKDKKKEKQKEKEAKPSELETVKAQLEKALAAADEYKRKWYSVSAEYDNYRKRTANAVAQAYADGKSEAVLKLLPVADNFGYAYDGASDEKTKAGIDKIMKAFNNILASLGIEELPVKVGDAFHESMAEAILTVPAAEGEEQNIIKQVLKKGYKQGDKVIRFAQVAVTI
jgi:molecular chaperone GrpE